jgi:disulfide bond formation protein DsbB
MTQKTASLRAPFLLVALLSFGLVGGGVVMAQLLNLAACPLCILQRMLYLLLSLAGLLGFAVARHATLRRLAALLMAGIAGTGIFVAGYQVWIQRFAPKTDCAVNEPWWETFVYWAGDQVPLLFRPSGLCSDPAWKFLSLSIAEWSLMAFTAMLLVALVAAFRRQRR